MASQPHTSDKAVSEATGWSWAEWFAMIDEEGGKEMEQSEIVKVLRLKADLKDAWWCQAIAVEYQRVRGLTKPDELKKTEFEAAVRRTYDTTPRRAWDMIISDHGLNAWLGEVKGMKWEKGFAYETKDGSVGEVLVVRPGSHVRLTWRPIGWEDASTVEVRVLPVSRTATISFHQENIPTDKDSQKMQYHWNKALDAFVDLL